jgi:hypothetical protein
MVTVTPITAVKVSNRDTEKELRSVIKRSIVAGLSASNNGVSLNVVTASGSAVISGHYVSDPGTTTAVAANITTQTSFWLQLTRDINSNVTGAQYVVASSQPSDSVLICLLTSGASSVTIVDARSVGIQINNINSLVFSSGTQTVPFSGGGAIGGYGPYTVLVQPGTQPFTGGLQQPMVTDNQGNILVDHTGNVVDSNCKNSTTTTGGATTTAGIMEAFQYIIHYLGAANGGWVRMAGGATYTVKNTITFPRNARGIVWEGAGFGDPSSQGGSVIQAAAGAAWVGTGSLFTLGNTSGNKTFSKVAGCWIGNMGFNGGGHAFANNANGKPVCFDAYNSNDGLTKGGVTYEDISISAGSSSYDDDFSNNDEGRMINIIHPASTTTTGVFGLYVKGGSLVHKFRYCRFFCSQSVNGGMFVAIPYSSFHDCVMPGYAPMIVSGTYSVPPQISFTGHTYYNERTQSNLLNQTPATTWFVGIDNWHGGVKLTGLPSTSGIFSGGGFFIVGSNLHINDLTGMHLFDTADSTSVLFATLIHIAQGTLVANGGTSYSGLISKGVWTAYHT